MPDPDGFEVLSQLQPWFQGRWFPVMVVSADVTTEAKQRALSEGARDFLTKPFDMVEVLLRIKNLLEVRFTQLESRKQHLLLEQLVYDRTRDLDEARVEALSRLALAAEYRDDATGEHTQRVGRTSALIARMLGLPDLQVALIRHAAPLHDVGKIGLRDNILLKPARLTEEEYEVMRQHVEIGRSILSGSSSPLLKMAEEIAWTHHERWDGKGLPERHDRRRDPALGPDRRGRRRVRRAHHAAALQGRVADRGRGRADRRRERHALRPAGRGRLHRDAPGRRHHADARSHTSHRRPATTGGSLTHYSIRSRGRRQLSVFGFQDIPRRRPLAVGRRLKADG